MSYAGKHLEGFDRSIYGRLQLNTCILNRLIKRYYMPIDPEFPKNHNIIGKHSTSDGSYFHFVWGPGRNDAESSQIKRSKMRIKPEVRNMFLLVFTERL